MQNNNESVATARAVHDAFLKKFPDVGACAADFHQKGLCVWENDPCLGPVGPFATGQWAAYVPLERIGEVQAWLMQFRRELSVFIHPNSGCILLDHSAWPLWLGSPWHLDKTQFVHEPAPLLSCPDASVPRAYFPCCGTWDRLE